MPKEKTTALEKLQDQHQQESWELMTDEVKEKRKNQALMILGGVQVANKIAKSISSQVMNALIMFQSEEMYRNFGFDNFVAFLQESEYAPMTKHEFYQRKPLFEIEGEQIFDLMNEIGVSLSVRKMLASGNYDAIQIDGNKVRVGDDEADLSNMRMVKSLIESFASDARKNKDEATKKQEKLEKAEQQVTKLSTELNQLKNPVEVSASGAILEAYLKVEAGFEELIKAVKKAPADVREQGADTYIRSIYVRFCAMKEVFGRGSMNLEDSKVEGEFKEVLAKMNDKELAELMN